MSKAEPRTQDWWLNVTCANGVGLGLLAGKVSKDSALAAKDDLVRTGLPVVATIGIRFTEGGAAEILETVHHAPPAADYGQ